MRFVKKSGDQAGARNAGTRPTLIKWFSQALVFAACAAGFVASSHAASADIAASAACKALQAKYSQFNGKTLTNAINPHTPGYEALDPQDPNKYAGFDIDLGEALGKCLGFNVAYKPVGFAALIPTVASGQADFVISDIYATEDRAKAVDFITYSKVSDGVLAAKDNPKKITGIDTSLCGLTAAENTGFVEVPLIENLAATCKAAGKPAPTVLLFDNNASCIQAILAGRADTYINDVNTVEQAVKAYPEKLSKALAVTLPYYIGIGVAQKNTQLRDALVAALKEVQTAGIETALLKKWSLDVAALEAPRVISTTK
ncbi:ABC transporter substrate-binding protein [Oxalobacteraceae bacterium CAVE-383]|nr:ABC transporter substrate-binding protein [Oxalobacteraceae bacterium CAVE-383]